jgi:mannose-6-phosphate isomerase-like protein (cupin superfamily)
MNPDSPSPQSSENLKIVEKPWGREIWVAHTEKYAFKIIEIRKGTRSSLQYHVRKHEHIYVDSGVLAMEWENDSGTMETRVLRAGEVIENMPGRKHRAVAVEDVRILEVSTPELDDVVRVEDDYRRS